VNTTFKTDVKNYEPKDYDLKERGPISARMALQGSLNIPAVKMLYLVGVGRVLDFAEQLGYTTFEDRGRFGLALVLGGGEVKLLEHLDAFATFANQGVQAPITSILKVEDAKGSVLEEWKPGDPKQVVDRDVANRLTDVLSDNGSRAYVFGINNNLTLPGRPAAAKTGTTNDFHDAWTMGYVPSLAAGVWVGNNDNAEMNRGADGSIIAAPIWQAFMKRALEGTKVEGFMKPPPTGATKSILLGKSQETEIAIDKVTGFRATALTPPDFIEQLKFREAHSELWYLDKDDPRGPIPSNPGSDPQFANWEKAVQDWATRTNWNTTSSAPTAEDDVHTQANQPVVTISSPRPDNTWTTRDPLVTVSVSAPRRIARIEATLEGIVVGSSIDGSTSFQIHVPNAVGVGFHDLTVTAYDDVGNRGSATVTVNITASPGVTTAHITSPADGAQLSESSFPISVTLIATDLTNIKKVDLFLQDASGKNTRLLASEILPKDINMVVRWDNAPKIGLYVLFPIVVFQDDTSVTGDRVTVHISNAP
jgi:membrane carboxypeptidase/penicillin-binding protein PbpC